MSAEYLLWFLSPLGSYRVLACPAPVNAAGPAMTLVRKFVNLWDLFPSLGSTPWAITKVTVVRGILVVNVRPHYICPRGFQFFLPGFQARRSWGNHKFNSWNSIFKTDKVTYCNLPRTKLDSTSSVCYGSWRKENFSGNPRLNTPLWPLWSTFFGRFVEVPGKHYESTPKQPKGHQLKNPLGS
jgi:hypothetical protein